MVGEVVSRYRILERLGSGGMGEVFRAEDLRLRRPVALKILKGGTSEADEARLLREARLASQLNHPGIAVIYEIDEAERDGGRVSFIAMEYVAGPTLAALAKERRLGVGEAVSLVRQIAEALGAAHARGIVHRDVKPGNVMVDAGRVKVLDFGVAAYRAPLGGGDETWSPFGAAVTRSAPGAFVGTVAYMSPEQALGKDVDARTDVFSLGIVFYELLAGARPFEGDTAVEVLDAILHAEPAPLAARNPAVPESLARIVGRMLAKDRDLRYPAMHDVCVDLDAVEDRREPAGAALPALPSNAIAVLAFSNITKSREDDWLGTGIMETVTADLKSVEGLTVIGCERICEVEKRLTGRVSHGESELAARLGREVGARWVVTGGYQRLGDTVRITARVSDVGSGAVLTTVKVDGAMGDLFSLQDRIVRELSAGLHLVLAPRAAGAEETPVIEAYEALSKGLINLRAESRESVDRAILFFERAVALDPVYARAHLELATALEVKGSYLAMPELLEKAVVTYRRCLELAPGQPRALKNLGETLVSLGRIEEGLASIRRAIAMTPNEGSVHAALARALFVGLGRFREAADGFEHALELNPQGGWYALQLAHCAALLREFPRAERAARRAVVLQEAGLSGKEGMMIVGAHTRLGQIAALQGRWEDALTEFDRERAFLRSADHALKDRAMIELRARVGGVLRRLGRDAEADAQLRQSVDAFEERLRVGADEPFTRYYVACAFALLGEKERALDSLEKAAATRREFTVERARIEPDLEGLRNEQRFSALLGSLARRD